MQGSKKQRDYVPYKFNLEERRYNNYEPHFLIPEDATLPTNIFQTIVYPNSDAVTEDISISCANIT
jgi:hypothetical protein